MDYINISEVVHQAPQVSRNNNLRSDAQKRAYINMACNAIDAFTYRSRYGLEVRSHYNVRVDLDINLTGKLPNSPFIEWLTPTADVYYFGQSNKALTVTMSDFSVDKNSGLIRNLSVRGHGSGHYQDTNFRGKEAYSSVFGETQVQYHAARSGSVEDNRYPYFMDVSFRAGFFAQKNVSPSGSPGQDYVIVPDVIGLRQGAEFYFSSDLALEPDVDKRYITEIDSENLQVYFEPALVVGLAANTKLRQVDKVIRSACGEIIADLITYPANTRTYIKNLGKFDLQKQWVRRNGNSVSPNVAEKLEPYSRV